MSQRPLTSREREVLLALSRGFKNAEIAAYLCISEETVRTHRLNACRKLHVHSTTAAVAMALRAGVIA